MGGRQQGPPDELYKQKLVEGGMIYKMYNNIIIYLHKHLLLLQQMIHHQHHNHLLRFLGPWSHLLYRVLKLLFFDDSLLSYLIEQTNTYAQKKISAMHVRDCSLYRNWRPVTKEEMMGFLSVFLNMGIIQLTNLKDYCSMDDTTNMPFFWSVFSRDRFFQIFGSLYVGNPESTTKSGKIQPLLDCLGSSFQAAFVPHKQIAVDESVISFKGG